MGIKHINKIFTLPLPTREKFILVALGRYASNVDDTCYPGIPRLARMTGYCEKTVQRAIKTLKELEIVDVAVGKRGNNLYTLNLTGESEAWHEYLYVMLKEFGYSDKDLESIFGDLLTCYKEVYNKQLEKEGNKEIEYAGKSLPAVDTNTNPKPLMPGKIQHELEKIWIETMTQNHHGQKVKITRANKWEFEDINNRLKDEYPVFDFLRYIIINWSLFIKKVASHHKHIKFSGPDNGVKYFPDISFLFRYSHEAVCVYLEHILDH